MYWNVLRLIFLTFAPLPIGATLRRVDPTKNEWIFSCREWKSPYTLAREAYLTMNPSPKSS